MNNEQQRVSDTEQFYKDREEKFYKRQIELEAGLRATGRTTRLIDYYIQQLFKKGKVVLRDHHKDGSSVPANERLVSIFEDRLNREHEETTVKYNNDKGTITAIIIRD